MRSRTSLVLSTTPISVEERSMSFPHVGRLGILTLVSAALLCVATPVRAQDDHALAGLLLDLLSESGRNSTTGTEPPPTIQTPVFLTRCTLSPDWRWNLPHAS